MPKTAYAQRMSPEEFAEFTKDMTPEEREEARVDDVIDPLFDMWLRFEDAFGDRAIDRLDVSDADAEVAAKKFESGGTPSGAAFAYLLRHIASRRMLRALSHKASAVWAAGAPEVLSFPEIHDRYAKLPKGDA